MEAIAHIRTDFPQKFGIPRQSGIVADLEGRIVFEPEFADPDAVRGIEGFSHLWLIWAFEGTEREGGFSPTVRPPRLGGRTRMGVFATRSPFRPNPIGLSCVELDRVEYTNEGPVLVVRGADLRDNTPIYDIKPYVAFTDSRPNAVSGFIDYEPWEQLPVDFPDELLAKVPAEKREALLGVLAEDARPPLQRGKDKPFALCFADMTIRFKVEDGEVRVFAVE